jgi:hypothetical protein
VTKTPKLIDISFDEIQAETEKAWRIIIDDEGYWLPKSQVEMYEDDLVVVVPEWLAIEKNLV